MDEKQETSLTAKEQADMAELEKELADKYGFTQEQVSKMAEIYPSLSLKDFFADKKNKECLLQILDDKGKQPIPVDKSQYEVPDEQIIKIVEKVNGKDVEKEVVMKTVLIVRLLNTNDAGKVFSRIPSGSESTGLLKVEYGRRRRGETLEGAMIRVSPTKFEDKDGIMRDGYSVEEITSLYAELALERAVSNEN